MLASIPPKEGQRPGLGFSDMSVGYFPDFAGSLGTRELMGGVESVVLADQAATVSEVRSLAWASDGEMEA